MEFLTKEVEFRQRVVLAQGGFQSEGEKKGSGTTSKKNGKKSETPTIAGFAAGESHSCVFCEKGHNSQECFKAQKMTLEEKKKILKEKKCCFSCFSKNHISSRSKHNLKCVLCSQKHYTIMCPRVDEGKRTDKKTEDNGASSSEVLSGLSSHTTTDEKAMMCSSKVPLQTLMVTIFGPKQKKTIRATYDAGSQRSYILRSVANEVGLVPVASESVVLALFGGGNSGPVEQNVYHVKIGHENGGYTCKMEVRDKKQICQKIPRVSSKSRDLFQVLKKNRVWLSDVGEDCPDISMLIGNDVFGKLLLRKVDLNKELTAIETKLGWVLSGTFKNEIDEKRTTTQLTMSATEMSVTQLWDLDTIGVRDPVETKSEIEMAEEAKKKMLQTITRSEDGRYSVCLPWKEDYPELPRNKEVAMKRMQAAVKKLDSNGLFRLYHQIFVEWETLGFIERVPEEEIACKSHLLPHRPVFKPDSLTTPVRPVFDASCRTKDNPSLNDCLEKGINYVQLIPEIILRFRMKKVAFISDIKKAFQMIGVQKQDRDMMRFLWYADSDRSRIVEYRHNRVMFGATCSPFILGAVLEHHLKNVNPRDTVVADQLLESLYVDNCVMSVDTEDEYLHFKETSVRLMMEAQMDLRLWMSNIDKMEDESTITAPVLGLLWNRKEDNLSVDVPTWNECDVTKRVILSAVQKIFDPIGYTAPAVIPMKSLLQDVWIARMKWDDVLSSEITEQFRQWMQQLPALKEIRIPRMVTAGKRNRDTWSIHVFTDACIDSYAAVVFLRVETARGVEVHLLEAKARVAPLKRPSIPRLELLGCFIGSRLAASIRRTLKLEGVPEYYWSDSTTALAWIKRNENWSIFVRNRVAEIRKNTSPENWRHVPGTVNPADLPSRGCSPSQLLESRWWEGPDWLRLESDCWPRSREQVEETEVDAEKMKASRKEVALSCSEITRYSKPYAHIVRVQAYVIRFCKCVKLKKKITGALSILECAEAELQLLKQVQAESFPNAEDGIPGVAVFRDGNGLLRVKTKIVLREDLVDFKYPILLPRKHPVVWKLIEQVHRDFCHAGAGVLMCKLRQRFWILQSRRAVKEVINHCHRCRRYSSKAANVQEAPLPLDRVKDAKVFQTVGVDLAGPLYLKNGNKMWIVVFTCAVFRAVHLEAVSSLSTKTFIQSLKKFVEIYGRPDTIYSDNGTNFVGAANLFKAMDWKQITAEEGVKPITWKFNPPSAAWWGGWWERLIRTMKDLMRRMLGKATLTCEELKRVLHAVQEVMNSRPLTYVSEDPDGLEPLTPAMFLHPWKVAEFPEINAGEAEKMRIRYKYVTTLRVELMQRFRNEYLSQLIQRPRGKPSRPLQIGEVVLIGRDDKKRLEWPLGRIVELMTGKDGKCRVARVRVQDGELVRPVQRLYPLELNYMNEAERELEKVMKTRSGRVVKAPVRFKP